ncbi:autotransporter outer membrane beta-barrel domain-containing protein [Qipengyuania sp. YG27]|uniref:Autotransporter outer membrane beta-barrel domain-containing protein n=1 Tax=Qipengyuania mesophila TaxID=2867246 RepID=A0ABS7JXL3_9SPHN|nr:autotransporter outer membrane beta-barrel domain-containing protein [Qipengyuania mesophila]MBX7502399.1 autotransporter outer membrane beta-barrel domain-containing protein [Qipengyuania mesophila]
MIIPKARSRNIPPAKLSCSGAKLLATTCLTSLALAIPVQVQAQECTPLPEYPTTDQTHSVDPDGVYTGSGWNGGSRDFDGGDGGNGAEGPSITVVNCGTVNGFRYIDASSFGGHGGGGANAAWPKEPGAGGRGGDGGTVIVENLADGKIVGWDKGLYAHSRGGDGGNGGGAATFGSGADGGNGGNGGDVYVINLGTIETLFDKGAGMFGLTEGGTAGYGGSGGWFDGKGGTGGAGGNSGSDVTGQNEGTITTIGSKSHGMAMHSVGGNGGYGGRTVGLFFAMGGDGGPGGIGGTIFVANSGSITTTGYNAKGIDALSQGGGGGDGGSAYAVGPVFGVAIGGSGGYGGDSGVVEVFNTGSISTDGTGAMGISAKSIAGGGGDGGSAYAVAVAPNIAFTFAMGGSGGRGGDADLAYVDNDTGGTIITGSSASDDMELTDGAQLPGNFATGILAQSVGGGGGNAHTAFTVSASAGEDVSLSANVAIGGSGGDGGHGGEAQVYNFGSITTHGMMASGIQAQSIGGGGGNGGHTWALDAAVGAFSGTMSINLAGSAGGGGDGGEVYTSVSGDITTVGQMSNGVHAQSVGGGGGSGGNVVSTTGSVGENSLNLGVSLGGSGSSGGHGGSLFSELTETGTIATHGDFSAGILAQSTGGGGGNGGSIHSYALALQNGEGMAASAKVDVGGSGGAGGTGGNITQNIDGTIKTYGVMSVGAAAHSIGGGGGNGGHIFALNVSASLDTGISETEGRVVQASVNVGGSGGTGADGGDITANFGGNITTEEALSKGLLLQSIGGGGGNGGNVHSYSFATSMPRSLGGLGNRVLGEITSYFGETFDTKTNLNITVDVGGSGGTGGVGGTVQALLDGGSITTNGHFASGISAQSIGGGGGNGGSAVANGFMGLSTVGVAVAVGGSGGTGGTGGDVTIKAAENGNLTVVSTAGDHSYGVHAQSIGGGGGTGGATGSKKVGIYGLTGLNLALGVGGNGGIGNTGGNILVRDITALTSGSNAHGVFVQSIGGGGGDGGASDGDGVLQVKLGGDGGDGNHGGTVDVQWARAQTSGTGAFGILAQSIGGGGGSAGVASDASWHNWVDDLGKAIATGVGFDVAGGAGNGGDVNVGCASIAVSSTESCSVTVETTGDGAVGILAQSIGGGGGTFHMTKTINGTFSVTLQDSTVNQGASGHVRITDHIDGQSYVSTQGDGAIGIFAQSLDSGGGALFFDHTPDVVNSDFDTASTTNANGGVLVDLYGSVTTSGDYASAIHGQSLSNAFTMLTPEGYTIYGHATKFDTNNNAANFVTLRGGATVSTSGAHSHGILLETASGKAAGNENDQSLSQNETSYGYDRAQTIDVAGNLSVSGEGSWGIYAANRFGSGSIADGQYTTHVILEDGGAITALAAGPGTGGGIYIEDDGNVLVDILGTIDAGGGIALDIDAGGSAEAFIGGFVNGSVELALDDDSSGTLRLVNEGTITRTVVMISQNGSISLDSTSGSIGTDTESWAIIVDTKDAELDLGAVTGRIIGIGSAVGSLTSHGTINGAISGAFDYKFGSPVAAHILNVSMSGGESDYIDVNSYEIGGPAEGVTINLVSLPTSAWSAQDIITVANGMGTSGSAEQLFGLRTATLATNFDVSMSFNGSGSATARLEGVDIDFTRSGLTDNLLDVAGVANAQIAAIADPTASSPTDDTLLKYLLMGANETNLQHLADEMTLIEPTLHYGALQSDANAQQAALNDLQSCGGTTRASVNPIVQGECYWGKYIWRDNEHLGGAHKDRASGLAVGGQFAVGERLHLGLSGLYEDTRYRSATALSEGTRVGIGTILKYNTDRNFASLSLMGSYSWADGTRTFTMTEELGGETLTAISEHESMVFTARLRGGRFFDLGAIDVTPLFDADLSVLHNFGYTEEGAGSMNVRVGPSTNTVFDLRPAVQIGKHIALGDVGVRLFGELGYRVRFGDLHLHAGLAEGYDTDYLAKVTSHREDTLPTYGLGMILDLSNKLEMRLSYDLEEGGQDKLEKFSAKMAFKF